MELERNGRNLQHFCRELARYFRNLLVASRRRRHAPDRRVAPRAKKLVEIAAGFRKKT